MTSFLYHVTLNTGHVRKTYPHEVGKDLYFYLRRIFEESTRPEGTAVYDGGYRLKTTRHGRQAIGTIYGPDGAPILTTACSPTPDPELWRQLHEMAALPLVTDPHKPPSGAYIADRIEPGAVMHMAAMTWTGDLVRCLGWMIVAPERIRGSEGKK